jgi:iron complex transport system substrate-binding protein
LAFLRPKTFLALAALLLATGAATASEPGDALPAGAVRGPRIISLYAADTEVLLRIGARDNLVGISRQETYGGPETVGWKPPAAFSVHDDVERFLAAEPDLILARPMHLAAAPALFETLRNSGVEIWDKQCLRAEDLFSFWTELGQLAGREAEARAMTEKFREALESFEAEVGGDRRPGVFFESIHREAKTFAPDSIPIWVLETAGGRNAAADARPVRPGQIVADYGLERLLEKADEIEVFISQEGPMNSVGLDVIRERGPYQVLNAFKTGRIHRIPEELVSRPVPGLIEGLTLMREKILAPGAVR